MNISLENVKCTHTKMSTFSHAFNSVLYRISTQPSQSLLSFRVILVIIFGAEKCIFSKSSFYTKLVSDPKYSFSVSQKYIFVASSKVSIFHQIQPTHDVPYHDALRTMFLSSSELTDGG